MGRAVLLLLVLGMSQIAAAAERPPETPPLIAGDAWRTAARLIDEQKLRSARAEIDRLIECAQADSAAADWTRALIVRSFLQTALAGERAGAAALKAGDWPSASTETALLHLYLAAALRAYREGHEQTLWPRERIETDFTKSLEQLTQAEVDSLIDCEYLAAWRLRSQLPAGSLGDGGRLLVPGRQLEDGVYDSFTELVSYEWAHYLERVGGRNYAALPRWTESALLPLLARAPADTTLLASPTADPLLRMSQLLDRLEAESQAAGRMAAAHEARVSKLRILGDRCAKPSWRARVAELLQEELAGKTAYRRSAMGFYLAADFFRDADRQVEALAAARRGAKLHPQSEGGQRCAALAADLVAPEFGLELPEVLDPARPSLCIRYKNLTHLELVAFRLGADEFEALDKRTGRKEYLEWFSKDPKPIARWSIALVDSGDYRSRTLEATAPLSEPGQYLLLASNRAPISPLDTLATVALCQVSPLRVTYIPTAESKMILVRECALGAPVAGVNLEVELRGADDRSIPLCSGSTDSLGIAVLPLQDPNDASGRGSLILRCRWRGHTLLVDRRMSLPGLRRSRSAIVALTTDRAIYRPGQRVNFKVQVCEERPDSTGYRIRPHEPVTVWLRSQTEERLDTLSLLTNDFGSAAGEFVLPAALPLGTYYLTCDSGGSADFQVAEYKRPSFRVELAALPGSVRFGEALQVRGRALYYFGQPVGGGEGSYRIRRKLRYAEEDAQEFMRLTGGSLPPEPEISGSFTLTADGGFAIEVLPSMPEGVPAVRSLSQQISVDIEVTSAAGERQSASTRVVVALVGVRALIDPAPAFVHVGQEANLTVTRIDLQGWAASGDGEYEIRGLQPVEPATDEERSRLRSWLTGESGRDGWQALLAGWTAGERVASGPLRHGEDGEARIRWRPRAGGVYRLVYRSRDPWGEPYETSRILLAVDPQTPLALPFYLIAHNPHCALGDTLQVAYGAAEAGRHLFLFELRRDGPALLAHEVSNGRPRVRALQMAERLHKGFGLALLSMGESDGWQCLVRIEPAAPRRELRVIPETLDHRLIAGAPTAWTFRVVDADSVGVAAELCLRLVDASLDAVARQRSRNSLRSLLTMREGTAVPQRTLWHRVHDHGLREPRWRHASAVSALERPMLYSPSTLGLRGRFSRSYFAASAVSIAGASQENLYVRGGRSGDVAMMIDGVPINDVPEYLMQAREDFRETALFLPLLRSAADGRLRVEFTAPEAPGAWKLKIDAVSPWLALGELEREVRTVRPLTVQLHLPRFLVGGDTLAVRAAVSNASAAPLAGEAWMTLERADAQAPALEARRAAGRSQAWQLEPGATAMLTWTLIAPDEAGDYAVRMEAAGTGCYDGERRRLPVLPARVPQSQTTSLVLHSGMEQRLRLPALARSADTPELRHEALAVSITAQPLAAAFTALQWFLDCPYATTDLVAERLALSASYAQLLRERSALRALANRLADAPASPAAASRAGLSLPLAGELPWEWRGLDVGQKRSIVASLLDESKLAEQRQAMQRVLAERQTESGGFAWFAGGSADLATTLRVLEVLALSGEDEQDRGADFWAQGDIARRAWSYVSGHCEGQDCRGSLSVTRIAELLYILTLHRESAASRRAPSGRGSDEPSYAGAFSDDDLVAMQAVLRQHWRELPLVPRVQAALALKALGDTVEAELIVASALDLLVPAADGTLHWDEHAPLGVPDAIAAHAFLLRAQLALHGADTRSTQLLNWLILNRELSGWGSTRTTAEALLTLASAAGAGTGLTADCRVDLRLGHERERFHFRPDAVVADPNLRVAGAAIRPEMLGGARVRKEGAGSAAARLTWFFESPRAEIASAAGGLAIERRAYLRRRSGSEWVLVPLAECGPLAPGDDVEIQLILSSDQPVDFVHVRDPRPAGFEPLRVSGGIDWQSGRPVRVEPRDTGMHFYLMELPAGQTVLRHHLRALSTGSFRASPACLRPFYRAEQAAYSSSLETSIR